MPRTKRNIFHLKINFEAVSATFSFILLDFLVHKEILLLKYANNWFTPGFPEINFMKIIENFSSDILQEGKKLFQSCDANMGIRLKLSGEEIDSLCQKC